MFRSSFILLIVLCILAGADYLGAWTAPAAVPPASNVTAPVNVGAVSQIKLGGLGVNALDVAGGAVVRGTASTTDLDLRVPGRVGAREYCDENGQNCVTTAGGGLGGGDDTITVGGRCFEPAWAVTCNWNWSGDGNDNSTYIRPIYMNPTTEVCASVNRSYQYHNLVLAECYAPVTYAWSIGAWGSCQPTSFFNTCSTTGTRSRTVVCRDSNGMTVADSRCPAPKPAVSQSCTRNPTGDC